MATPTGPPDEGVAVASVAGYDDPTVWSDQTLIVTSWGGEYQAAQQLAIFEPFERLTGATIETANTSLIALRRMVEEDEVEWDVCDVLAEDVLPLANLGVIEELDYNVIDPDGLFDDARLDHGLGSSFFSTVLAYRLDRWPEQGSPRSWRDFWDIERFPGPRGLHRQAQGTLEFALLADGVALDELYPLDVPRAFAALDRVLPALTLWWEQGAQPAQAITAGDLDMVSVWHSRITRLRDEGADVGIEWSGGALSGDAWVIPRGAPHRDMAMDFVNFATRPEVSAAFSTLAPFGPANERAFELLPPEIVARLPTAPQHRGRQFVVDYEWWFQHREATEDAFEEWLAERP